jgi:DNA-binding response OmpR family regulator
MNGVDLCRRIREDMRTSHIPVIMLTAKANVESKIEGLEKGADDYLVKPFDANELKLKIRNMLRQREKLSERTRDLLLHSQEYQQVVDDNPFHSLVYSVMEGNYIKEHFTVEDMGMNPSAFRKTISPK